MCAPQAGQLAIATVKAGGNYLIQDKASRDAIKFSEKRAEAIGAASVADAVRKYSTVARREDQEREATARQIAGISRQARQASGAIQAQAGAAGVQGASLDALLNDFEAQEAVRIEIAESGLEDTRLDLDDTRAGIEAEATSRIFNAQGPNVARPSIWGALFQIGTDALSSYAANSSIDPVSGEQNLNTNDT